jgi:hypothetical protein
VTRGPGAVAVFAFVVFLAVLVARRRLSARSAASRW